MKKTLQWIKRHKRELSAILAVCIGMYVVVSVAYPPGKPLPQQRADSLQLRDTINALKDTVRQAKQALPSPENTIVIPPSQLSKVAEVIQETTDVSIPENEKYLIIIKRDSVKRDTTN